jgi:hypothetical protein
MCLAILAGDGAMLSWCGAEILTPRLRERSQEALLPCCPALWTKGVLVFPSSRVP